MAAVISAWTAATPNFGNNTAGTGKWIGAILIAFCLFPPYVLAEEPHPLEPLDTSSPGATLYGLLEQVEEALRFGKRELWVEPTFSKFLRQQATIQQARRALDLSEVPIASRREVGVTAGVYLYEVLSRIELPTLDEIPDAASFDEEPATYTVPRTEITLVRIGEGERAGEFLFSPETVSRAEEFYKRSKLLPYTREVLQPDLVGMLANNPGWMIPARITDGLPAALKKTFFGHALWKWLGLLAMLLLFTGLLLLLRRLIRTHPARRPAWQYLRRLALPLAVLIILPIFVRLANVSILNFGGAVAEWIGLVSATIAVLAATWTVWLLPMLLAELIIASPSVREGSLNAHLVRLVGRIIGIVLAIVVIFFGASLVGVPLLGMVAGVSIGGLAVALATQDTLKNLLGSLMIYMDKPYEVGHRINVKGHDGVVEEIGLRSTKIRLLNGPVTTIPNEKMATEDIVNVAKRPFIQRIFNVRIAVDTSPDKIGEALGILRDIVSVPESADDDTPASGGGKSAEDGGNRDEERTPHPNEAINQPDFPPRVFFNDLTQDYLNFLVIYWYHPPAYWDYLDHATWLNTRIVERLDQAGIRFAMPARKLFAGDGTEPGETGDIPVGQIGST
ncbi:MAG: mechanosensitive ion channel family protein [Pseudomonadota bacterium]|nr:mechanosensitive ion channel family protein [Pseudomonadota bacterium]